MVSVGMAMGAALFSPLIHVVRRYQNQLGEWLRRLCCFNCVHDETNHCADAVEEVPANDLTPAVAEIGEQS